MPISTRGRSSPTLRAFSSLRGHNFRLFWGGQAVSLVGTWMQTLGQVWLVLQLTHSAWQLGLFSALQSLPLLFFSLLGGVFADRWPKRRILLLTQSASMIQSLLIWILIATGALQLWYLYVLAILLGLVNSAGRPASRSFIVEMVGREDLPNAVALYSAVSTLARIAGPGIAGVIIAAGGMSVLFLLNAISFLPAIVALILIRSHELRGPSRTVTVMIGSQTTWQRLRDGVVFVWRTPAIGLVILVVGLVLLFGSNFNVVLPLFATGVLRVGATGFGLLSAATGVGALLATLWIAWGNRQPTIRGVLIGTLAFGIVEAAFALVRVYPLSLVLIAGIGFAESAFAAQATTALQTLTPDRLRGRVTSVQVLFFDGSLPLGSLLMGWLSHLYGAAEALFIGAALSMLVVGAAWIWLKPAERNAAALSEAAAGEESSTFRA